jgi:hypothetical protein
MSGNQKMAITTLVGGAAVISRATEQALQSQANTAESLLDDYIATRLIALEEKVTPSSSSSSSLPLSPPPQVKLVTAIEKGLDVERERIELDRRDIQIQRAQLAFFPPR